MIDLRDALPRASWTIGTEARKSFITVHYNGPAIEQNRTEAGWIEHLKFIAGFHMGPYLGADGIQYHYAILPSGAICKLRNELDCLWHCANQTGNNESIAIHFPLGGAQAPTSPQWQAFTALADGLLQSYGMHGRKSVYGHREWPYKLGALPSPAVAWAAGQSACPGNQLAALLDSFRSDDNQFVTVRHDIDFAAVRQGPARWHKIAWNGTCTLEPGRQIELSDIVEGEKVGNSSLWGHWPAGGFIHMSCFE